MTTPVPRIDNGHVDIDAAEKRSHQAHERCRVARRPRNHGHALLELLRERQVDRSSIATAHGVSTVGVGGHADHRERDLLLPRVADPGRSQESNLAADRELGPIEGLTGRVSLKIATRSEPARSRSSKPRPEVMATPRVSKIDDVEATSATRCRTGSDTNPPGVDASPTGRPEETATDATPGCRRTSAMRRSNIGRPRASSIFGE